MSYITVFYIGLGLVVGMLLGMLFSIYALKALQYISENHKKKTNIKNNQIKNKQIKNAKKKDKKKKKESVVAKEKKQSQIKDSEKKGVLSKRLPQKDMSWTEYNCIMDNENIDGRIMKNQEKEEKAYRYAKRKEV